MSWSRSYTGSSSEVLAKMQAEQTEIEASLPDFEKGDVQYAVNAAAILVKAMPDGAAVGLTISGHGYRNMDGGGAGGVSASIAYTMPTP